MKQALARLLTIFAVVAAALVVVALILTLKRPAPVVSMPNPNGYDDLVGASRLLVNDLPDIHSMSDEELRAAVAKNADALKRARAGLDRECRVALPPSAAELQGHLDHLAGLKRLARAFVAEGRLAEIENRPEDAAQSYLNCIRTGQELIRGGLIIDGLVGVAVEAMGTLGLEKLAAKLDAKGSRMATAELERVEARRETAEMVLQQEKDWVVRAHGMQGRIARLVTSKSIRQTERGYVNKANGQARRSRLLLIQLASRAYELEKGEPPRDLASLVPLYLKAVPVDPVANTNISLK